MTTHVSDICRAIGDNSKIAQRLFTVAVDDQSSSLTRNVTEKDANISRSRWQKMQVSQGEEF